MFEKASNNRLSHSTFFSHFFARTALREVVRLALCLGAVAMLALGFLWLPDTAPTKGELVIGELLAAAVGLELLVAACFVEQPFHRERLNVVRVRRGG